MEFCIRWSSCLLSEIVTGYWLLIDDNKNVSGRMMIIIQYPIGLCKLCHLIWNKACELNIVISGLEMRKLGPKGFGGLSKI